MKICVFGGTGFVGSCLAATLAEQGHEVVIPTRNREECKRDLIVLPKLDLVQCDVLSAKSIERVVSGCDVVANLIGILNESGAVTFESVHIEFNRKLAESISRSDVRQVIYVSALNAATGAPSKYLRTKGKAEAIFKEMPGKARRTIIRPSVIFGRGDSFTTLFGKLVDLFPALMLPCPQAQFQPIWVEDLCDLVCRSIGNRDYYDGTFQAGGPETLTLREIIGQICAAKGRRPLVIPLGQGMSYALARTAEMIPFFDMLSRDNCDSMSLPSVCAEENAAERIGTPLMSLGTELGLRFGRTAAVRERMSEIRNAARR